MGKYAKKAIASLLAVLILVLPAELMAKGRRGATLVVTRLDGTQVSGELISVKPDTLLLLTPGAADLSVPLTDIRTVRIVRRSKAGTFGLIGGAAGFVGMGGFVLAVADEDVVDSKAGAALLYGLLAGAAVAAVGAVAGMAMGADSVFTVAGQRADVAADYWARLASHSRMGRQPGLKTKPGAVAGPAQKPGVTGGQARGPRLRLNMALRLPEAGGERFGGPGAFRFPEEAAPEAGPYPLTLQGYSGTNHNRWLPGPLSLAYDWQEHWAAEIEILPFRAGYNYVYGDMAFVSSLDGLPYWGACYGSYAVSCLAVLFGLSYRPVAPSALQRHAVEAGLAVGPAWAHLGNWFEGGILSPEAHKVALCARVKAAYDFFIVPALSIGAFAGYRYAEVSFGGLEGSMLAEFNSSAEPFPGFERPTAVALPDLPVKASDFYWGVRVGVRI